MTRHRETIKTTCPRDCYDGCGIVVEKENGAVRRVLGDPDHHMSQGALCSKCAIAYNGAYLDPTKRLQYPLRRVGAKGDGKYERVSWEEALSDIAARLTAICDDGDARKVIYSHYSGTLGLTAYLFPYRFFFRLGATEVDPDSVCNKAGHVVLGAMMGDSAMGFDARQGQNAGCVVVWGANPSATGPHQHKHWLPSLPGKVVVIDPIAHPTARAADLHLQLRPGTDAALAFSLMHVAQREGLLDQAYIAEHTLGFDQIIPEVEMATPEWGEAVTGVPAAKIQEAGVLFGQGPSMMWLGQGLQRQTHGGNVFRAALTLAAVTGNIGRPGAGIYYLNGAHTRGVDLEPVLAPELCGPDHPEPISHGDMAAYLEDPARSRALVTWNNNILASSPNQARLRAAMKREDLLTVVVDIFQTDTASHADYILPAASFLECDDIVSPYFNNYTISAQARVMEPMGESLSNQEIFRRLARAMNFKEPQLFEQDPSVIDHMLGGTPFQGTFDDLKKIGTAILYDEPRNMFADGTFATPSGKIEIACEALAAMGHSLVPTAHADAPTAEGKIRVLSPASEWLVNSSYGNDDQILERMGEPKALLNPAEAARRGLSDGTAIVLQNDAGSLPLKVGLSDDVPDGVALVHKSRWPGKMPGGVNVNVLYDGAKADFGDSTAVHSVEARIVPA